MIFDPLIAFKVLVRQVLPHCVVKFSDVEQMPKIERSNCENSKIAKLMDIKMATEPITISPEPELR